MKLEFVSAKYQYLIYHFFFLERRLFMLESDAASTERAEKIRLTKGN